MPQYCRYCAYCFEADDFRCSNHPDGEEPHWTRQQINQENHCPNFALSDLGDVGTGKKYKERHQKRDDGAKPISIWDEFERVNVEEGI